MKIREIYGSYLRLQQFNKYKPHPLETEIVANLLKFAWKNLWNHIKWTYLVAGFHYLEPLCPTAPGSDRPVCGCDSWELFSFPSSSFIVVCYLSLFFPLDSINKQHTIVSPESQKPSSWTPTTIALYHNELSSILKEPVFTEKCHFFQNYLCINSFIDKIQLLWEGHKNLLNLPQGFDVYQVSKCQNHEEDSPDFCGLLRKAEL